MQVLWVLHKGEDSKTPLYVKHVYANPCEGEKNKVT